MKNELNYYTKIAGPAHVLQNITVQEWFSEIRTGKSFGNIISNARTFEKGSDPYDEIKIKQIPCVTWNFLFDKYKNDNNIIESTGFLYFDIDILNYDISILDKKNLFAHHKSLSGKTWSIIVRADGINKENYSYAYDGIAKELGIFDEKDNGAKKMNQYTVLSFDPEIYINYECHVFNGANYPPPAVEEKVSLSNYTLKTNKKNSVYVVNDTFLGNQIYEIRLTDATDYVNEGLDYQVFNDKIDVRNIFFPGKESIKQGSRNRILSTMFSGMLNLNNDIPKENAYRWLAAINRHICAVPVFESELIRIFNSNWKNKNNYKMAKNKNRRIIFSDNCSLSKSEKLSICRKEIGKLQTESTNQKIIDSIENLNIEEKITNEIIAKKVGISLITTKRYTQDLRTKIKDKNSFNKSLFVQYYQHLYSLSISGGEDISYEKDYEEYLRWVASLEAELDKYKMTGRFQYFFGNVEFIPEEIFAWRVAKSAFLN